MVEGKPRLKYRGAEVIAAADACDAARSLTNLRLQSAESRCCRSRPVIALRPASASIGTSTIGVGRLASRERGCISAGRPPRRRAAQAARAARE